MAYDLRERKQKSVIVSYESEEEEDNNDSSVSDPDYTRTRRPRNKNYCKSIQKLQINPSELKFPGINGTIFAIRSRGRPPKKRSIRSLEEPNKRRRSGSFSNQELGSSNRQTVQALGASSGQTVLTLGASSRQTVLALGASSRQTRIALGSSSRQTRVALGSSSRQTRIAEKTILSWLINHGGVSENDRVQYIDRRILKEGMVRRDGIWCRCCNVVMSIWDFEMHAGNYSSRPYKNTYVFRTGKPLVNLLNEMWHKKEDERHLFNVVVPQIGATDANDDACLLCADGGDLICCEKCPSAFHPTCINMENIPQEDFLCTYCVCKHCGGINGDMLTCSMCGKRYHWDCYVDRENVDLNDTELALCCGPICKEVYWKFKRMLGVRHAMKEGLTWTLVHRMKPFEIEDEQTRIISNCKTEVAWDFLNECFSTATDRHSRINILQSVVCNRESNLTRMNFRGFFVALLENNDGIVSAATVRMHGKDLAEMPYIATQENYRGQGMARKLFDALGYVFSCIGLKEMVIPSIDHLAPMWQGKYGFTPIDDVVKHKLVNFNTLMFPGTIRLQKIFPDAPASFSAAAGCSAAASTSAAMDNKNDKNCKELALLNLNLDPPEPPEDEKVRPVIWIDD